MTAKRRVYTGKISNEASADAGAMIPDSLFPVLEEQPKWEVLAEILDEIERDSYFNPVVRDDSNGTTLIMCSDQRTCRQLREYLQSKHVKQEAKDTDNDDEDGNRANVSSGKFMLRRKLRDYLVWKKQFTKISTSLFSDNQKALEGYSDQRSHAPGSYRGKPPPNKRRRVRGGSAAASASARPNGGVQLPDENEPQVANLIADIQATEEEALQKEEVVLDDLENMEDYFQMFEVDDLVVVHPFDGDMDEQLLEEIKPRYVIMYEPDAAFIRRVEVYRSSHTDRNIRVYFMYYGGSVEEQRYLSAVRKEKDAFTKLIRERGVCPPTSSLHPLN